MININEKYFDAFGNELRVDDLVIFTVSDWHRGQLYKGIISKLYDKFALILCKEYNPLSGKAKPYYKNIAKYISPKSVKNLEFRSRYLQALEAYGVDNWNGFEDAIHDTEDYLGYKIAEE